MRRRFLANSSRLRGLALIALVAGCGACLKGPDYKRPSVDTPAAYKEAAAPAGAAQPAISVKWWEVFGDPQLNAIEEQIAVSNQNLKQSEAQYRQARALVRFYRAELYPTATVGANATRTRYSDNHPPRSSLSGTSYNEFTLPGDVSYEPDLWGSVRRTVENARANAQASFGDLAAVNLSLQAELAEDYFELRSADAAKKLLDNAVSDYEKSVQLTETRHNGGLASDLDVEQARTVLETTRAQDIDVGVARAQFEHAVAVLVGKPPATFTLAFDPVETPPPDIPPGVPSEILQRRPDVAAAERRMAAANAQIGVAEAAFYPNVTLSASGGFDSGTLGTLLQGPGLFYSVGASALETVFDAGKRRATTDQARAAYDQQVASYREAVLDAFQEVEDNLAAMRVLDQESRTQDAAVRAAEHALQLSTNQYKGGLTNYLQVLVAENAALSDEHAAVDITRRRYDACVQLIKALGGGWNAALIPTATGVGPARGAQPAASSAPSQSK